MDEYAGMGEFVPSLRDEWKAERKIPLENRCDVHSQADASPPDGHFVL